MYVEIAREFSKNVVAQCAELNETSSEKIVERMFRRILVREPETWERDRIVEFYNRQRDSADAWMLVARALMNTDEAITTP